MTPDQKTALKQALDQHSFRMSVKDAAPEDVAQLPEDFQVPSYSANTSPLYENQLFPKITSADDLINLGYATPEGVPTESGQMAIALKKAGALNDDYTLNDTGKAMMASREDLLKEENLPLYMKSKELDLDDAGELSWGEVGSNFLNELKKGGKNLIDLAGYDTSSMTPQEKASFDLQSQAAVGGLVKAGAILPMGLSQIVGNATIKAISDNESEENLGLALLNQKFEKQSDEINNAKTAEVVDAMGQMFGAELGMEEARQQDVQTIGAERAQELESGGESAGGVAAMFTPGGPSMLTAKVAFGVAGKGLGAAFKPISRSLLQADAKAAMVLDKTKQLASLQRQAGALQLTTQAAERQAAIGESMAQKFSQAGFTDRANNALRLANQARTKGQEAAVRLGGFADEIATVSDDLAKATQSATVADKVLQITQKAGQIPYLPITALGKTLEYTGRGMIGIDKGLSNLASKIGADKAYNAMNKITTLSGLGGVGAASGLGPAAFIPAAIKTAWSTAPYIKATGEYVGLMGKEAMKARGQIGFWKRMYEMPNKGPMHRAVSGLMDTATLGGRVTGAAGRVGKGLAASYPVDLAFEWVAEGGEMNPNVLKQAAVETLVFGGTGAALGGITMGSVERIRSLQNGDATNFYRSITDPSQRVMFNGMAPDMKRVIGTFSASNPGAKITFTNQGAGKYDRNTKTVMVNPNASNPLKPLLTHEFMHHMLNNGIGDGVVAQLVGDGYQTGGILRSKDGGYEQQYEEFKSEYVNRLRQQHERNIKLRDAIGDPVPKSERAFQVPDEKYLAEEYFIETNVDDMLGLVESGKLGKMAGRMVLNDKVRALGDAILNKSAILRDLHFRIGGVMDKQGKMVKGNGFLGGQLYQSPEIRRMFNKMVNESVGRRGGIDAAKMKARNGIELPISGKNDPILGEMSSLWESDADGNPLIDKNGDYIPLSKQTDELRSQAGMLLVDDLRARQSRGEAIPDGELAYNPENNTWSGQYLNDRQIELLSLSGRFNSKQIKQLKLMNESARATSDPNADPAARGHRFSVIYQPALKKNRKGQWRYDQIKPQLRDVVPYGVEISKDGNILIRIMSTNQLFANASEKAATKRGRSLYDGNMDSILRDTNAIIDLHGKNQATDAYFKDKYGAQWSSHKEFINSVFGNVGKGHKDINPLVASDRVDAVVKSYRLDRMNKATQLVGATQLPYQNNLIKINYLPEGEPILDANGEPKDLRYTPRYEERMPEQRQMPEVSPEESKNWFKQNRSNFIHVNIRGNEIDPTRDFTGWVLPVGRDAVPDANVMNTRYGNVGKQVVLVPKEFVTNSKYNPDKIKPGFRPSPEQIGTITEESINKNGTIDWSKVFAKPTEPTPSPSQRFMPEKLDADYIKAVDSGDVGEQQRLVDEAARKAGYDSPKVYHGTPAKSFNVFDINRQGSHRKDKTDIGFFFTSREGLAEKYTKGTGRIVSAHLSLKNPYRISVPEGYTWGSSNTPTKQSQVFYDFQNKEIQKAAKDGGHDGIIVEGSDTLYIVFDPSQIKSADPITRDDSGNIIPLSKRFDITSKDLRFMPEGYKSHHDETLLNSAWNGSELDLNRPFKASESLPSLAMRTKWEEKPLVNKGDFDFKQKARVVFGKNKNGEDVTFKFDPNLLNTPSIVDFSKVYSGEQIQYTIADRMSAVDGDMGGSLHPFLKNNDIVIEGPDGRKYVVGWGNNSATVGTKMRRKAKDGAKVLMVYLMGKEAHESNTRTVRLFDTQLENSSMPSHMADIARAYSYIPIKEIKHSSSLKEVERIDGLLKKAKTAKKGSDYISKLKSDKNLAIKEAQKFKVSAYESELAGIFRKVKSSQTRLNNGLGKQSTVDANIKELINFATSAKGKKLIGEIPSQFIYEMTGTFDGRKSAVSQISNLKLYDFDGSALSAATADMETGDKNAIVTAIDLSDDQDFFMLYMGDDPKQMNAMTESEKSAAAKLKKNSNFVIHEAYDTLILSPLNGRRNLNSSMENALDAVPDSFQAVLDDRPSVKAQVGKTDAKGRLILSEDNLLNTVRDQQTVPLIYNPRK